MRTILFLIIFCLFIQSSANARDYINIHVKEMNYANKYGSTEQYFEAYKNNNEYNNKNIKIKDPKLITFGEKYENLNAKYKEKLTKDKAEYKKVKDYIYSKNIYKSYRDDFYLIYKIAERIIRANNLDFINWRITIDRTQDFNASSNQVNCLVFNSGLIDTFRGNDDALAFIVGHEIAHSILGHHEKLSKMKKKAYSEYYGLIAYYKYFSSSKKAEFAADIESAKLLVKAGYDLNNAKECLAILNNMDYSIYKYETTHPEGKERIKNFEENIRYFLLDEWIKEGKYNIINSDVLECSKSSQRKSFVIIKGNLKDRKEYYRPESKEDVFKRVAYISYINNDMKNAFKYFRNLSKLNKNDFVPYVYLSYICEYLYNETKKESFLNKAKKYINKAYSLNNENKYILEQQKILEKYTTI